MLPHFNSSFIALDFCWQEQCWPYIFTCVVAFLSYKIFRPYFPVRVDCWFCRTYQIVPYSKRHGFNCSSSSCGQYNGFTADGDYNKVINEQYCPLDSPTHLEHSYSFRVAQTDKPTTSLLCYECTIKQQRKIEKLAHFIPTREDYYLQEYQAYSRRLEQIYELCTACRRMAASLLQKQDVSLRNMYSTFPKMKQTPKVCTSKPQGAAVPSPVLQSTAEKRRKHFQNKMDESLNHSSNNVHDMSLDEGDGIGGSLLKVIKIVLKLSNLFASLVALLYIVCECSAVKVSVVMWTTMHSSLEEPIRILFEHVKSACLFGVLTQYFGTRANKRCWCHLLGFLLWIATSLLVHLSSFLCKADWPRAVRPSVILAVAINAFLSVVCLWRDIHQSRPQAKRSPPTPLRMSTSSQSPTQSVERCNKANFIHPEEQSKLCAAMNAILSSKNNAMRSEEKGASESFMFFNHNVKIEEFKEKLNVSPGSPRPLISPSKFNVGFELHSATTKRIL